MTTDLPERPDRVLLVWDAPNMDMSLGSLLGARPTSAFRPRFDAVGRWLLDVAGPDAVAEACVFTNVVPGSTEVVRPWVEALRNVGFAVFAKPKITDDSDVDDDMLAHIELRADRGRAVARRRRVGRRAGVPASRWRTLVAKGTCVTVIGFREYANFALTSEVIEFVDLEEIDGRVPRAAAADDAGDAARHRRVAAAVPLAASLLEPRR